MDFRVEWTLAAADELKQIWDYVAANSSAETAAKVARKIVAATDDLGRFPRMGPEVFRWAQPELRERIIYNYRLIYRVGEDRITILAIRHGSREISDEIRFRGQQPCVGRIILT